jgi:5-methylcytosine-specific restriction endonuclease McrA
MRNCRVCGKQNVKTKTGPATCSKCRREKYLHVKRHYQQSVKGRATARAREERPDVREGRRRASAARPHHPKPILTPEQRAQSKRRANERYAKSEKMKAKKRRDYARRKAALVPERRVTAEDWLEIVERHKHRCHYCGKRKVLTLDHVVPISRGGKHVKENIVPACRSCNSTKKDKMTHLC